MQHTITRKIIVKIKHENIVAHDNNNSASSTRHNKPVCIYENSHIYIYIYIYVHEYNVGRHYIGEKNAFFFFSQSESPKKRELLYAHGTNIRPGYHQRRRHDRLPSDGEFYMKNG